MLAALGSLAAWVAVGGAAAAPAAHTTGTDPLVPAGSLSVGGSPEFRTVAVSGRTVVAGSLPYALGTQYQGVVYVFTEPSGGWRSGTNVAELIPPAGPAGDGFGASVAISGNTVVVLASGPFDPAAPAPGALYVFTRPAGGWAGGVHQSAKLLSTDSACGSLSGATISGALVAADCHQRGLYVHPDEPALVFREPARGWSGTLRQSAKLVGSKGKPVAGDAGLAIAGSTVFVGGVGSRSSSSVLAFDKPRRGWTGQIRQSATLSASGDQPLTLAVAGDILFAANQPVFSSNFGRILAIKKPRRGWTGKLRASSRLVFPSDPAFDTTPVLAVSGRSVVVAQTNTYVGVGPSEHGCPCDSTIDFFSEPPHGWAGTQNPQSMLTYVTAGVVHDAVQNRTVLATADSPTVELFQAAQPSTAGIQPSVR
jgi:hypothetical protein